VAENPIRTLVSLDDGIEESAVRAALPTDPGIQVVGFLRGVEESWTTLQESPTDLLVIACSGYSERALSLIEETNILGSPVSFAPLMPAPARRGHSGSRF